MVTKYVVERSIDEIGFQITNEETKKTLSRIFARREMCHNNRFCLYDLKYNRFGMPYYETFSAIAPESAEEARKLLRQEIIERAKRVYVNTGIQPILII